MIRPDDIALCHQYKPKASAQTPAEYATAIQGFRRGSTAKTKAAYIVTALLMVAALYLLVAL